VIAYEFFMDWLMRKVMVKPPEYTQWPPALRLFYRFLSEKGYLDDPEPIIAGLQAIEPAFIAMVKQRSWAVKWGRLSHDRTTNNAEIATDNFESDRQAKRQKDHGANEFSMRKIYKRRPYQYRFTRPPQALLKAQLDNIAIVPASMLPWKATWQKTANKLPRKGVLLCHSRKNVKQRKLLKRVEEVFKRLGYAVMNLPLEQVVWKHPKLLVCSIFCQKCFYNEFVGPSNSRRLVSGSRLSHL
jgi:hypothetical protein